MRSIPAASVPIYREKHNPFRRKFLASFVKDIYVGDMRSYYSNLLQAAALTNRGANQAAGLLSGVSFMRGNEMVIAETFLLV